MRLREFIFGTAMSFSMVMANAITPLAMTNDPNGEDLYRKRFVPKPAAPSPLLLKDQKLQLAYYDTLQILTSNNPCSNFFGGPNVVEVFDQLISKVRKDRYPRSIGMRQRGSTSSVYNHETNRAYRLFEALSINTDGPFYAHRVSNGEASVPWVGHFGPNTREVRVLMLLHELGHLVKGSNGDWLLANDGNDEGASASNTRKIEDACQDQIRNLGKAKAVASTEMAGK